MFPEGLCIEGLVFSLGHYWEVLEHIGGAAQSEKFRLFGEQNLRRDIEMVAPSCITLLPCHDEVGCCLCHTVTLLCLAPHW